MIGQTIAHSGITVVAAIERDTNEGSPDEAVD
jgi:hypothetical protein